MADALQFLAGKINAEHKLVERSRREVLKRAFSCGLWLLGVKLFCIFERKPWEAWIRENLAIKPARVRHYLKFYFDNRANTSLVTRESLHVLSNLQPTGESLQKLSEIVATIQSFFDKLSDEEVEKLWDSWTWSSGNRARLPRQSTKLDDRAILRMARRIKTRRRQERLRERERQRAKILQTNHPLQGERFKLLHGNFVEVWQTIEPGSVDAIITDPPYPREFLPLFGQLSGVASKLLKPGGNCLVATGLVSLPEVLRLLSQHLTYRWTLCHGILARPVCVNESKVYQRWNPYIWLTNGPNEWEFVSDVIKPYKADKRFHEWGKSVEVMADLIKRFTVKGELILDPFLGGGTTAIAAVNLKRPFMGIDIDEYAVKVTAKRLYDKEGLPKTYVVERSSRDQ